MNIKKITYNFADFDKVEKLAKEAFPPEEYLAPSELIKMSEQGGLDFWGLYDNDNFVGFMVITIYEDMCYLFFLAIDSSIRSKGYGGQALLILDEIYPNKQQVVDFEMVDELAPNNSQRITRKAFYLKNGYKETGKCLSYRNVDFEILCRDDNFNFETFKQMLKGFNIENFNPRYFEK